MSKYHYRKAQKPHQLDVYLWFNRCAINPSPYAMWFDIDPMFDRIDNSYVEVPDTSLILICLPLKGELP
jgi:hypothetical protein